MRLHQYYADGFGDHRPVSVGLGDADIDLTILSAVEWVRNSIDLQADEVTTRFAYDHAAVVVPSRKRTHGVVPPKPGSLNV
ncbi:hypothetical protein [Nocardioides sp.]|uniref:hypothetical protein n=1 Tax=Nocardioides sp. TaxID=35761 RepID=UPI0025E72F44|nr:hypothetical protein [Nocardioides sp.]